MKSNVLISFFALVLFCSGRADAALVPYGNEFTYQGRLTQGTGAANGRYDFTFALQDAASGGVPIVTVTNFNVAVTNGLFTTDVNFGANIFIGYALWIELGVRSNGMAGAFTVLSPRQALTPAPNAHYASLAATVPNGSITAAKMGTGSVGALALQNNSVTGGALQNSSVTGTKIANGQVVRNVNGLQDNVTLAAGANLTITPSGNTLTLAGSADWKLGGNAGTLPGANFLGTIDNQPLSLRVNDRLALRIEPTLTVPNIVGGLAAFRPTVVGANVRGAVVAGGNAPAGPVTGLGAGDFHAVYDSDGVVGGGFGNKVGSDDANPDSAPFATVGGGVFNAAINYASTVAGGDGNLASGVRAMVGGGAGNWAVGDNAFVGAGANNRAFEVNSTIGGGQNNIASNIHATVAGGGWNTASGVSSFVGGGGGLDAFGGGPYPNAARGDWSAVLGGWNNIASGYSSLIAGGGQNSASGIYGVVAGGELNQASGDFSFAAGNRARATHPGSFVWADSLGSVLNSARPNHFLIRPTGGFTVDGVATLGFEEVGSGSGRRVMSFARDGGDDLNSAKIAYRPTWGTDALAIVGAGTGSGSRIVRMWDNVIVQGELQPNGVGFPNNFGVNFAFAAGGNYLAFGHPGVSEDFIGYRDNTFFFKDSPGGGDVCDPTVEVAVLRITGGCDVAEPFHMSSTNIPGGAVVIIDEENPGRLKLSEQAYDTRVAGIVSGANGIKAGITLHQEGLIEGGQNVALSGRVYVQADASNSAIKPGDLLTTSDNPGYAMKVTEHARAQGAILGKAMTALKEGKGMVLVLVTLQ